MPDVWGFDKPTARILKRMADAPQRVSNARTEPRRKPVFLGGSGGDEFYVYVMTAAMTATSGNNANIYPLEDLLVTTGALSGTPSTPVAGRVVNSLEMFSDQDATVPDKGLCIKRGSYYYAIQAPPKCLVVEPSP